MADTVTSIAIWPRLRAEVELDTGLDMTDNPTVVDQMSDDSVNLTPSTTPPASVVWSDSRTLAGASESLDLRALDRGDLADVDLNGKKVQALKIKAAAANNAAGLLFKTGASNGYNILGHADGEVTLLPGSMVLLYVPDKLADVDATHKIIDVSGTAADQYDIQIVAG